MFFQDHSAAFDYLIIKNKISFYGIVGHELLAFLKVDNVVLKITGKGFRIKVRYNVSDLIVFFKNRSYCIFDMLITLHQIYFFLEDRGSKIANILDLFLEVHKFEGC